MAVDEKRKCIVEGNWPFGVVEKKRQPVEDTVGVENKQTVEGTVGEEKRQTV